jgi:hypothetical protein
VILLMGGVISAGCGGSATPAKPVVERVCDGSMGAAAQRLGYPVRVAIVSRDPTNVTCVVSGRGRLRVRIVTQTGDQAYTEFDTETSHQSQVYGPGIHTPGQIPQGVTIPGAVAAVWIPAQREAVATNAQPGHAGTYVTVTVSGSAGATALRLAQAITRATFAAHPGRL